MDVRGGIKIESFLMCLGETTSSVLKTGIKGIHIHLSLVFCKSFVRRMILTEVVITCEVFKEINFLQSICSFTTRTNIWDTYTVVFTLQG